MRGMLGAVELRGAELIAAAEAHDALFSFDYRARTAALEVGLPLLPEGEILFVNLDPRAVLDVESSMRTTWPVVGRLGADPSRICLEIIKPERCPDRELLREMVAEHRKRGALRRPRRPLRRPRLARLPRAAAPRHRQDRHGADRRHPALRRPAARWSRRWSTAPTSSAPRSSPRASSASTSSARWPSSASTSARASTSASRPSARWRSTPASSARTPTSASSVTVTGVAPVSVSCALSERFFASALRAERGELERDLRFARRASRSRAALAIVAAFLEPGSVAVSFKLTRQLERASAGQLVVDLSEPVLGDRVALGGLQDADVRAPASVPASGSRSASASRRARPAPASG